MSSSFTDAKSVAVYAVSIASLSVGNFLLKVGMDRYRTLTEDGLPGLQSLAGSPALPIGAILMAVQFVGTLTLFRWGWDSSVVVPVMGLCYVGTAILGQRLLGEPVSAMRWMGIGSVLIGVFLIARSSTTKLV